MLETERTEEVLRKLQRTKGKTYTISLPKTWIKKMKLKSGTMIRIIPQDDSLVIVRARPKKPEPRKAPILVSPKDKPELVLRKIDSAYLVGYDEISIETAEAEIKESLRARLKDHIQTRLTGIAIVTDSPNKLELKVVTGFEELSMKYVLEKISENIISMHKEAVNLLEEVGRLNNQALEQMARKIRDRDNLIDGLHLHGIRLLKAAVDDRNIRAKIGLITGRECLGYRLVVKSMERIGDHAAKICRNIVLLKKRIDREVLRKIQDMSDYSIQVFSNTMQSFFDFVEKRQDAFLKANNVIDDAANISTLEDEIDHLLFKETERPDISPKELSGIKIIVESIRRTAEYSSDIAEIVLNLTIIDTIERAKAEHFEDK